MYAELKPNDRTKSEPHVILRGGDLHIYELGTSIAVHVEAGGNTQSVYVPIDQKWDLIVCPTE